jgi:WD40 repeat protein
MGGRSTRRGGCAARETPVDVTVILDLPEELGPITRDSASRLHLLAELPAEDPSSAVIFRDTLYVGNAHGQLFRWTLRPRLNEQPAIWRVHSDWVYDVAAVDFGGDLLTASRDGLVRLWPLFASDGWWLDYEIHTGEVASVALSPDDSMLASGGQDAVVRVRRVPGAGPLAREWDLRGHRAWVWDVAFSPDGTRLASGSADGTVKLWSVGTGELLATLTGHRSAVSQVAFAPGGGELASASWDGTVRVWDASSHGLLRVLEGHDDWVLGLAYAPSGDLLVSSGADGKVLVWDPGTGELLSELMDADAPARAVAFDAQGRYLVAVADDDHVLIWGMPGH